MRTRTIKRDIGRGGGLGERIRDEVRVRRWDVRKGVLGFGMRWFAVWMLNALFPISSHHVGYAVVSFDV